MTETATAPAIKPKKRNTNTNTNGNNVTPITPGTTQVSNDEMMALVAAIPAEERARIIALHQSQGGFKTAYANVIATLAGLGYTFENRSDGEKPLMMLAFRSALESEDGEKETVIFISSDGEVSSSDDEEDDDEDEDDAPRARARKPGKTGRGPGRPPKEYAAKDLLKALHEYMKEKGKSQEEIAAALEISQPTISTWVRGTSEPRNGNAHKLAKLVKHYLP